jgi:phage terminase large subunit
MSLGIGYAPPAVQEWWPDVEYTPDGLPTYPLVRYNGKTVYGLQPRQMECMDLTPLSPAHDGVREHIAFGGAAGGGKSHLARTVAALVATRYPGSRGIIFRESYNEVMKNHAEKMQEEVPLGMGRFNKGEKAFRWANGSVTYFGYLESPEDVWRYHGTDYDYMVFEEATRYAFASVNFLTGQRLRSTGAGLPLPFALYPSNPGGPGHTWYKRLFIDRAFRGKEDPRAYGFIQAFLADNAILNTRDPSYKAKLDTLMEPFLSWYRDGNWKAGSGLYFSELDRRIHVCRAFTHPPEHWPVFGGFDWGYTHPWRFGVYATDEDGTTFKLDTLGGRKQQIRDVIQEIEAGLARLGVPVERLTHVAAGLDIFHKKGRELGYEGPTYAELMLDASIPVVEASVARVRGAMNVRMYLSHAPDREPALRFCDTPGNSRCLDVLESRIEDPKNQEDCLKTDADLFGEGGDDDYDETRYALASRPMQAPSVGLDVDVRSAWDPQVLQAEHERTRRPPERLHVRVPRGNDYHPDFGGQF